MAKDREIELEKKILVLEAELERLSTPPFQVGTVTEVGAKTLKISTDTGGTYEVLKNPELKEEALRGTRVVLNPQSMAVIGYSEFRGDTGEVAVVDEINGDKIRAIIKGEPRIVLSNVNSVKPGDEIILDPSGAVAVGVLNSKKTKYSLEKVPVAPWKNIGGLADVVAKIKDEIEEPFIHRDVFERYGRKPAKGILLYGPPGCGKTMIARSIAYSLSQLNGQKEGHFINVKGPEILDKFIGNSEAAIRRIYTTARDVASETLNPVVVFIDEAESVLKRRGSGISSDVYDSIVPQFLAELDGVNGNGNVITVLATNRQDILDPAIVRDGRIDRRIRIPRPNEASAKEILQIYLSGKPLKGLPLVGDSTEKISEEIVRGIYSPENIAYIAVSPKQGELGRFGYRHLISGAMIKGIVDRACGYAIKREIQTKKKAGITMDDLETAVGEEFDDNLGFEQALVPEDWEDVFGTKGRYYQDLCSQGYIILERPQENNAQLNPTGGKNGTKEKTS